ncbi:unnamed protein product, partial [Leptidea sinapis]
MKTYVRVMKHFLKTTTLHGFKYLCAKCYYDRAGWAVGCLASACCAAVLCTVVWARYLQMPALLTLRELRAHHASVLMPLVAVSLNDTTTQKIRAIFGKVLRRKYTRSDRLALLGGILDAHKLTLTQALFKIMPECDHIIKMCQWRRDTVPCSALFKKALTQWGVCCVKNPLKVDIPVPKRSQLEINKVLTLALQCSDEVSLYNCDFFTKYDVEEWVEPFALIPGFSYEAQLTFTSVSDSDESGLSNLCVYHQNFSKNDPQCNCLPPCKKVTTGLALVPSKMNALNYSVNPLIAALNNTLATLLTIQVRISGSRMFVVNPTETWITLLSSIGGIFNMFLGVGFFSVVELLFLFLLRLPIAFRRS